jgi:GNAT superfamily N-acetyltransferase
VSAAGDRGGEPAVAVEPRPFDDPICVELRQELAAELLARFGEDTEPGAKPTSADVAVFLVAQAGQEALGCGGVRLLGGGAAELKRMFVRPAARRSGVGREILAALEAEVLARGCDIARVETSVDLPEAIAFYERAGYREIPCFGAYTGVATSRCFERRLTP